MDANDAALAGVGTGTLVVSLVICVVYIAAMWKIFSKAGEAGWLSIIPIVSTFVLFKIVYGSGWKMLFMFIPILDILVGILMMFRLAKAYGKGAGFGLGLFFLSPIFILILAFGDSSYEGPVSNFI